jgi:PAS domain S-box-containing protein
MVKTPSISDFGTSPWGYAEFFDGIPAAIFRTTLEGKIVYCNKAFAQLFGYASASELMDYPVIELYYQKKDRGVFIHSLLQRGCLFDLPISFKMKDGTPILCAVSAKAVPDDDGIVVHLDGFLREITGQTEPKKNSAKLEGMADGMRNAVIVMDLQGGLIDVNPSGEHLLGCSKEELLGQSLSAFFASEDREFFPIFLSDILKIGRGDVILAVSDRSDKKRHLDLRAYLVKSGGYPHHIKCIARDVNDVITRQQARNIDEKFQGVLEMAGGVAHSFNQPLTVVNNLLNQVIAELPEEGSVYPKFLKIRDQIKKMNDIVGKIGNIRNYAVMEYVAGIKIVDIDRACRSRTIEDNS